MFFFLLPAEVIISYDIRVRMTRFFFFFEQIRTRKCILYIYHFYIGVAMLGISNDYIENIQSHTLQTTARK